MNTDYLIGRMLADTKRLRDANPNNKLPKDCICVIHPRNRIMLERISEANPVAHGLGMLPRTLTGLPIYEDHRVSEDKFELMSLITYYQKYPPIFPTKYSRWYVLCDNAKTFIRRCFYRLKWNLKRRK